MTSLEIFIFFVVPLYKSSKLHGNVRSIAAPFRGAATEPSPAPPLNEANISSPNIPLGNPDPPAREAPWPKSPMPPKPENPKNSEKISSGLRVENRNDVGPPASGPPEKPPAPGGGTCPFNPSSPYWSYTARFCGSLKTYQKKSNFKFENKYINKIERVRKKVRVFGILHRRLRRFVWIWLRLLFCC